MATVKIGVMGDPEVCDAYTIGEVRDTIDAFVVVGVDAIVVCGDLMDYDSTDMWADMLDALTKGTGAAHSIPILFALGNRDLDAGGTTRRTALLTALHQLQSADAVFDTVPVDATGSPDDGSVGELEILDISDGGAGTGVYIDILDDNYALVAGTFYATTTSDATLPTAQSTWLAARLAATGGFHIIVKHHPLESTGGISTLKTAVDGVGKALLFVTGHGGGKTSPYMVNAEATPRRIWQLATKPHVATNAACVVSIDSVSGDWSIFGVNGEVSIARCASAATGDWNTAATWSPAAVPGDNDFVTIAGAHTVTVDAAATCGSVLIDNAGGGLTLAADLTVNGDFKLTTGTFTMATNAIDVDGDIIFIAGAVIADSQGEATHRGGGNTTLPRVLKWNRFNRGFARYITIADGYYKIDEISYINGITPGGAIANAQGFSIRNPSAGWWGPQTGTITGNGEIRVYSVAGATMPAPGNDIDIGMPIVLEAAVDQSLTLDAEMKTSQGLTIKTTADNKTFTLDANGHQVSTNSLTLGAAGTARNGIFMCGGGVVRIDAVVTAGDADEIAMEDCLWETTGALDFSGITVSAVLDQARIIGIGAPQIDNFAEDSSNAVHSFGCADGGTNGDLTFDDWVPPGTLAAVMAGMGAV